MVHWAENPFLKDLMGSIKLSRQGPFYPIKEIFHYTLMDNWKRIERKKEALQPKTHPIRWGGSVEKNAEYFDDKYIVGGVNSRNFQPWRDFGIHNKLLEYIARGQIYLTSTYNTELALLSFPVEVIQDGYVLEHAHDSQKRFNELYGYDDVIDPEDQRRKYITQLERYSNSVVRLANYDGSYQVPEIWIPHAVSFEDLTLVETKTVYDFELPNQIMSTKSDKKQFLIELLRGLFVGRNSKMQNL